jgi:cbb3-type cytochrome oxidase maturation protein
MEVLYFLIPLSVTVGLFFLASFFWAVNNDQFEDLEKARKSILKE